MQNSTALLFLVLAAMIAMTWATAIESEPEELETAEQRHYGFGGNGFGHQRGGHHGFGGNSYGRQRGFGGSFGDYGGNYYRGGGDYGRSYGNYGGFY